MKKLPKKFVPVISSFANKPKGGLWGCRGDEWKEWCEAEKFNLKNLKLCVLWRLKKGTKIYRIKSEKDFIYLCENYENKLGLTIDYKQLAKDYDAVEVVGDIVYKLRFGTKRSNKRTRYDCEGFGLYSWDVPSICVLNPEKIVMLGELCQEIKETV